MKNIYRFIFVLGIIFNISSLEAHTFSLKEKKAAENWLINQGISNEQLEKISKSEIAKRLLKEVYLFCTNETPYVTNVIDLFENCRTSCGGYSYLLRGILEHLGFQTRYANFHNIQIQGNHTGVEVKINGYWGFLDPTFGVFFTKDNLVEGKLLSAFELHNLKSLKSSNIFRVKNREQKSFSGLNLNLLFTNKKINSEPLRSGNSILYVDDYKKSEQVDYRDKRHLLPLEIPLKLDGEGKKSFGSIEKLSLNLLEKEWLLETNKTLNDNDIFNDISYNSRLINNLSQEKISIVKILNIENLDNYEITFNLFAINNDAVVQINKLGKNNYLNIPKEITLNKGSNFITGNFSSELNQLNIMIRAIDKSNIRLLGIKVNKN